MIKRSNIMQAIFLDDKLDKRDYPFFITSHTYTHTHATLTVHFGLGLKDPFNFSQTLSNRYYNLYGQSCLNKVIM